MTSVALLAFAARLVVRADHRDVRPDRLGATAGLQRDAAHAGDLGEHPLGLPDDLEHALHAGLVLQRVQLGEVGGADDRLVHLRRVFHRAGALADVDVEVGAEVLLAETQVVLEHAHLADLGQRGRRGAAQGCGERGDDIADGFAHAGFRTADEHAALAGRVEFEDDRLIPARLVEPPQRGLGCDGEAHAFCSFCCASAAPSTAARSSMSVWVFCSVTHTSRWRSSMAWPGSKPDARPAATSSGAVSAASVRSSTNSRKCTAPSASRTPGERGERAGGVGGAGEDGLADLGHALRSHQREVDAGGDAPEGCGGADPFLSFFAHGEGGAVVGDVAEPVLAGHVGGGEAEETRRELHHEPGVVVHGDEAAVRSAEPGVQAERLDVAVHDVGAQVGGRGEDAEADRVGADDHDGADGVGGVGEFGERGLECAGVAGGLDPDRGGVVVEHPGRRPARRRRRRRSGRARGRCVGAMKSRTLDSLSGCASLTSSTRAAAGDAARHRDRGRGGLVAVIGGYVDDVLVEQLAHQRLVLEQRLEAAVVLVRLAGVCREELAAVDDLVDDRGHRVLVGAGAEEEPSGLDRAVAAQQTADVTHEVLLGDAAVRAGRGRGPDAGRRERRRRTRRRWRRRRRRASPAVTRAPCSAHTGGRRDGSWWPRGR